MFQKWYERVKEVAVNHKTEALILFLAGFVLGRVL